MKMPIYILIVLLISSCSPVNSDAQKASIDLTDTTNNNELTLEQKVGQLFMIGFQGTEPNYYLKKMISERNIGGVLLLKYNVPEREQTIKLIQDIQKLSTQNGCNTSLFISIDQEGGLVERIKYDSVEEHKAQKDITSLEDAYQVAYNRGVELKKLGININYSPVVEHITDEKSFLYKRVFRTDNPNQSALYAREMIKGYTDAGIIAVPKHYPGHTNNSVDSHGDLPQENINEEELKQLVNSFDSIMPANPSIIMTSHVMYPEIDSLYPATLSKTIIDYLDYSGIIISDDMEMKAIADNYTLEKACVIALKSGVDILMFSSTPEKQANAYNAIIKAVKEGEISEELINQKVDKIIALKKKFISN
jgi:beta-N-acetylhexosaminidase